MKYPKRIMKISELTDIGFTREMLMNAYRVKGQIFAWKMNPGRKTSTILFDTEEFEKWRMKQLKAENAALYR